MGSHQGIIFATIIYTLEGLQVCKRNQPRNVYFCHNHNTVLVESTGLQQLQCSNCFAGSSYSVAEEFTGPYVDLATGTFP